MYCHCAVNGLSSWLSTFWTPFPTATPRSPCFCTYLLARKKLRTKSKYEAYERDLLWEDSVLDLAANVRASFILRPCLPLPRPCLTLLPACTLANAGRRRAPSAVYARCCAPSLPVRSHGCFLRQLPWLQGADRDGCESVGNSLSDSLVLPAGPDCPHQASHAHLKRQRFHTSCC